MKEKIVQIIHYIRNIIQDVQAVYAEKGSEPFKKPSVFALIALIVGYLFYNSSKTNLTVAKDKLDWLHSIKDHYGEYTTAKQTIKKYSANIPAWKDKDDFLSYTLTNIASKNGITFSSIESQREMPYDRVFYVTKQVRFTTTFEKLIKFLADIEKSDVLIEISQINIIKKENITNPGMLDVDLTVGTIFVNL
ncbi:MAG: type 4a pilus biogenesis protein PilO [Elusimicrobiales bacterium]|nr:type 4a pilus biogenesis protein PilO [Elusimicrobiales bacterium]